MDTTGITCSDCGSAIDHLSQGDPCPSCGGTKRTIAVEAHSTITVSSELTEAVVDRAWPRPWSDRWNAVGIALGRLRRAYGQDRIEGDEVRLAIKDFFVESTHMYDALKTDSSTGLSGTQTYKYVDSTVLRIGHGFGNTYKHNVRLKPEDIRAYVSQDGERGGRRFAVIKYWSSKDPVKYMDALDLAEQCYGAWRAFLQQHGLPA